MLEELQEVFSMAIDYCAEILIADKVNNEKENRWPRKECQFGGKKAANLIAVRCQNCSQEEEEQKN